MALRSLAVRAFMRAMPPLRPPFAAADCSVVGSTNTGRCFGASPVDSRQISAASALRSRGRLGYFQGTRGAYYAPAALLAFVMAATFSSAVA